MSRNYQEYIRRKQAEWGAKFDPSQLASQFIPYFNSQARITVRFYSQSGELYDVKRGTIGATTGWRPCFLLMHNSRARGSSCTLSIKDLVGTFEDFRAWQARKRSERARDIRERLEYLRGELRAEKISYGELAELQALSKYIAPDDTELLEAAGVKEHKNAD